jgi:transcriptional regulator with GAF, ATPase, and Fis domain
MARPRRVDPSMVVEKVRGGMFASEVARELKISRVRVGQILEEHAPDLLVGKFKRLAPSAQRQLAARQRKMVADTQKALAKFTTKTEAARHLGLTNSGLSSRLRRFGLEEGTRNLDN